MEPIWAKEYLVAVEGPPGIEVQGSGWYAAGASVVLQAPDVIESETPGERQKFASWESVGSPVLAVEGTGSAITAITADAPYTVRATYERQFFVDVRAPSGTLKRDWVREGDELLLEAPPIEEIVPGQQRLVFRRWEGQQGLISPRISGVVSAPVSLTAVYDRQVMVTVDAPFGASGGGWHKVGSTVIVSVPGQMQSKLIFKRSFEGFPGYPPGRSSIEVLVQEPMVITALYSDGVSVGVLSLFLLLPLVAVVIYFANRWVLLFVQSRRSGAGPEPGPSPRTPRRSAG